jgi:hypothetical protein
MSEETKAQAVAAWEAGKRSWHCTTDHNGGKPCQKCIACADDRRALDREFAEEEPS